jgi:hypothetical protein
MPTLLISVLLRYVLPAVAVLGLFGYGVHRWHSYQDSLRDEGRAEVTAKWDADAERRRKQVTDITLLWNDARQRADDEASKRERETHDAFEKIQPERFTGARVLLPGGLAELFGDVTRAANGAGSGPGPAAPAKREAAPVAVPVVPATEAYDAVEVAGFMKAAGLAYADAVNQWAACVKSYTALTGEAQ